MADVLVPLSVDEDAILQIAKEGNSMMPIGRWEEPVRSLAKRGLLSKSDEFNYFITAAGRAAIKDSEAETDRALKKAYGNTIALVDESPVGPTVVGGTLFYKMPDGSSLNCHCIREPCASQIVAMWRNR